jgi:hypothetical protein
LDVDGSEEAERDVDDKVDSAPKTADEEAMDALLGKQPEPRKGVVARQDDLGRDAQPEDYEAVPVENFGATLLRSYGWDGKMKGKVKEISRHANLTGLGTKNVKGAEDLDAWIQRKPRDGKDDRRPPRLLDYRREEEKRRERREERSTPSYKRVRERERGREQEWERDGDRVRR